MGVGGGTEDRALGSQNYAGNPPSYSEFIWISGLTEGTFTQVTVVG